jgi:hypothetical protein
LRVLTDGSVIQAEGLGSLACLLGTYPVIFFISEELRIVTYCMGCINISCVHASMSRTRLPCSSWGAIPRFYWQSTPKLMKIPLVHCAAHHEHQHVITTASQGIFTPRGLKYFLFTGLRYSFEDSQPQVSPAAFITRPGLWSVLHQMPPCSMLLQSNISSPVFLFCSHIISAGWPNKRRQSDNKLCLIIYSLALEILLTSVEKLRPTISTTYGKISCSRINYPIFYWLLSCIETTPTILLDFVPLIGILPLMLAMPMRALSRLALQLFA